MESIYSQIAARTGGDIYIGVVGPVRTGKSTLIKRLMEKMVIPAISDPYRAERARDELPQSGSGRTIMTSEPKFVPEEAVEISPDGSTKLRVRLIDSVGYMVEGAVGAREGEKDRMVTTPWFDYEIPMTQAAELGTKKVMEEHCTIGLVVTTDGTVTDIPREDYIPGEKQAIQDMIATGKPFLVVINTREPKGQQARELKEQLRQLYGVEPVIADCQVLEQEDIAAMLRELTMVFPMTELRITLPRWLEALEADHPVKTEICQALLQRGGEMGTLKEVKPQLESLEALETVDRVHVTALDPATGVVCCTIALPEALFYRILSQKTGLEIGSDGDLMGVLTELAQVKSEYDQIADALSAVKATGYGVVMPRPEELKLETPQTIRKNGAFGVRLKAGASSIHMVRVDIDTEIAPLVGDENQCKELVSSLSSQDPQNLWQSNIFGKSVYDLIQEGLNAKLLGMNQEVRGKFRGTLTRIVNEGATGLICLIL